MKKFKQKSLPSSTDSFWIYGLHAVCAALENPERPCHQLIYLSEETFQTAGQSLQKRSLLIRKADKDAFDKIFPGHAVHQGIAMQISPFATPSLEEIVQNDATSLTIATLDQVTDPHNLGAIARSAAAFGIQALILPDRHTPPETSPVLYKSASGALEHIPLIRVTNLARTLEQLRRAGFWNLGFDETGEKTLDKSDLTGRLNLVFGGEGKGIRRLTRELCDFSIRLPTMKDFGTLNVSNAAAIAFYEARRQQKDHGL